MWQTQGSSDQLFVCAYCLLVVKLLILSFNSPDSGVCLFVSVNLSHIQESDENYDASTCHNAGVTFYLILISMKSSAEKAHLTLVKCRFVRSEI